MENIRTPKSDPASAVREPKPWLQRLLTGEGFSLPKERQFWWGVHIEQFLSYARKRGEKIPVEPLAADYQAFLRQEDPPMPTWRLEQVRMALEVFVRGIEHWRWEADAQGRLTPRFRLKSSVEAPPAGLNFPPRVWRSIHEQASDGVTTCTTTHFTRPYNRRRGQRESTNG